MIIKKILMLIFCCNITHASDEPASKKPKTETFETITVTLYHTLNTQNHLPSVKAHGLYSFPNAHQRKLADCPTTMTPSTKLDRRKTDNDIYFDPIPSYDTQITYKAHLQNPCVFNALYRKNRNWVFYNNSKKPLAVYLQAVKNLVASKTTQPEKTFRLHPIDCTPEPAELFRTSTDTSKRKRISTDDVNDYQGEVVLSVGHIPPEDLDFLDN